MKAVKDYLDRRAQQAQEIILHALHCREACRDIPNPEHLPDLRAALQAWWEMQNDETQEALVAAAHACGILKSEN